MPVESMSEKLRVQTRMNNDRDQVRDRVKIKIYDACIAYESVIKIRLDETR